jgi:hypothetical protein
MESRGANAFPVDGITVGGHHLEDGFPLVLLLFILILKSIFQMALGCANAGGVVLR